MSDPRLFYPATSRNRDAILAELERLLPASGTVLEIASGSGEHAAYFAPLLPQLQWQPSDGDAEVLESVAAWRDDAGADNLLPPIHLDVTEDVWPVEGAAAIFCANMIHIAPWSATEGLMAGAGRALPVGGLLIMYGPFMLGGEHTAPSNAGFDRVLRDRDESWGVRDLDDVAEEALAHGLHLRERVEMPANNFVVVFERC